MKKLSEKKAIEIINNVRSSNPFSACQPLDEYVKKFTERYKTLFEEEIEVSYIKVAEVILKYDIKE